MVKTITQNDQEIYQCEECGFRYADKDTAEQCQAWCGKNKSCNLDIIKHALPAEPNKV